MSEPLTDGQLHMLAQEITLAFASGAWTSSQGFLAAAMRGAAEKDLAYLVEEYQRLRAMLEKEQNEHATCEGVNARRFQTLTDTILTLVAQVQAMRPIVEAAAQHRHSCGLMARAYLAKYPMPPATESEK